jgi:hypothetical protein
VLDAAHGLHLADYPSKRIALEANLAPGALGEHELVERVVLGMNVAWRGCCSLTR